MLLFKPNTHSRVLRPMYNNVINVLDPALSYKSLALGDNGGTERHAGKFKGDFV